jgi:hypothetical protein
VSPRLLCPSDLNPKHENLKDGVRAAACTKHMHALETSLANACICACSFCAARCHTTFIITLILSPPSRLLHAPPSSRSSAFLHRPHARIHTHTHTLSHTHSLSRTHTARYTCAWAPSSWRRWRSRSSAALAIFSRISSPLPDVLAPPPQLWSPMLLPPPTSTAAATVAPGRCWAEGFWRM